MKIPAFTAEQIEYLNAVWQEKCPEKSHSDREIWIAVGARSVVRHINSLYEAQIERQMKVKENVSR